MLQSIVLTLPELILSTAALLLMMVVAWFEDRSGKLVTWLAIGALVAAAICIPGYDGSRQFGFGGLVVADSFAALSRVVIYAGAAAALIAASGWFGRDGDYRAAEGKAAPGECGLRGDRNSLERR